MMKKRRIQLAFVLLCLVGLSTLSGCKTLGQVLGSMAKKPTVKYKRMHLRDVSFKGIDLDFDFELTNPNPVGVTFTHFAYDLKFEGSTLFKGMTKKGLAMKANAVSPLRVPFSVEFRKFVKSLLSFFQAKEFVSYHLHIEMGFQTPIGDIMLPPLDIRGRIPVPKLPKLRFVGASVGNISFTGAQVNFKVGVKNEGKFPIKMRGFDYNMQISGVSVGSGNTALSGLKAGGEQVMTIPVNINFLKVGMAIAGVLRSRKLPYNFAGNIDLGLMKMPFAIKGNADL